LQGAFGHTWRYEEIGGDPPYDVVMLQAHLRKPIARIVDPVARGLLKLGISPNAMTAFGALGTSLMALIFYPQGRLFEGTLAIVLFIFSDLLDGTMARISGRTSRWGAFVDSTLDRVADGAIFAALLIYYARVEEHALALLTLVALVGGSLVPYVKARAESLGLSCDGGFAERAERLVIILVVTGFSGLGVPYISAVGLWLLVIATFWTLGQRLWQVRVQSSAA
jgi:CDP-diacylglycerol---glycerol-3-phosphate 3-phosphatidyltransferase